jgi:hypothetical protein
MPDISLGFAAKKKKALQTVLCVWKKERGLAIKSLKKREGCWQPNWYGST